MIGSDCNDPGQDVGWLEQGGSNGSGKKWLGSGHIWKEEQTKFAELPCIHWKQRRPPGWGQGV